MPPVMGAGAFIMAEFISTPYLKIALAATIPALLYYLGVTASVHFGARKDNLARDSQRVDPLHQKNATEERLSLRPRHRSSST